MNSELYGSDPYVRCEVCGKHHVWSQASYDTTELILADDRDEAMDHCPECDPLSVRPGARRVEYPEMRPSAGEPDYHEPGAGDPNYAAPIWLGPEDWPRGWHKADNDGGADR